jgi:hypothetical protein
MAALVWCVAPLESRTGQIKKAEGRAIIGEGKKRSTDIMEIAGQG